MVTARNFEAHGTSKRTENVLEALRIMATVWEWVRVRGWGVQPHFCPSPNPDFDVSWERMGKNVQKWGKKYMEREGKSIRFSKLLILYYHYFRHINYY